MRFVCGRCENVFLSKNVVIDYENVIEKTATSCKWCWFERYITDDGPLTVDEMARKLDITLEHRNGKVRAKRPSYAMPYEPYDDNETWVDCEDD